MNEKKKKKAIARSRTNDGQEWPSCKTARWRGMDVCVCERSVSCMVSAFDL